MKTTYIISLTDSLIRDVSFFHGFLTMPLFGLLKFIPHMKKISICFAPVLHTPRAYVRKNKKATLGLYIEDPIFLTKKENSSCDLKQEREKFMRRSCTIC